MEEVGEILKEFLVESYENLDQLDNDLLALEGVPDDRERLACIFRTVHSIKGTSGFLGLPRLENLTHVGENLLVPLRDGDLRLDGSIADALLQMVDAVRQMLRTIESTGSEGEEEYATLKTQLEHLRTSSTADPTRRMEPIEKPDETVCTSQTADSSTTEESTPAVAASDSAEATPDPNESSIANRACKESQVASASIAEQSEPAPEAPTPSEKTTASESLETSSADGASVADTTLRIDVGLLDNLMNLVGELVLARNQVLQYSDSTDDASMVAVSQKLNLVTTELQEAVMKTRMQPIRNAWSKLPRVIRDLAHICGKKVQVEMDGADTELDKTVLEAIKDPLTHMVRNSVDHGIEDPEARIQNGKPETGTLFLRAFHEGGQVNIEIADDGRGLDLNRIRKKAIQNGIITEHQAESINDRDTISLVLLPGFSTAPAVTNVSGRGVGMDVVKTNIERIGGTIDILSTPGEGTTMRIKLPLTLAIVPALVINSDDQVFAIPQVNLLELVRLDAKRAEREIELVYGAPVYRLRGTLLPLLYLNEILHRPSANESTKDDEKAVNIVVLQANGRPFGLIVDGITDTQEIVVKPLDRHLKTIPTYAGATIMGNGTVSLILDVVGIAQQGGILTDNKSTLRDPLAASTSNRDVKFRSWLIVDAGGESQAAILLDSVTRLEEIECDAIEFVDGQSFVQYRDQIMPLIDMQGRSYLPNGSHQRETIQIVVYCDAGQNYGLVVGSIIDIVDEPLTESIASRMIISGKITGVVDPAEIIRNSGVYCSTELV